jgi:hypothetical protein
MIRRRLFPFSIAGALVAALIKSAVPAAVPTPELAPGQKWSIKSPTPTTAKVVIGRVEPWKDNKIAVHVSLVDVPMPSSGSNAIALTTVDHVPFDRAALAESVDQLLATNASPAPPFEGGYERWRSDKHAGIFTVSVSQAIALLIASVVRERT